MRFGSIYRLVCDANNKCYVGQTIQKVEKRVKGHFKTEVTDSKIRRAVKKYGRGNFSVEEIFTAFDQGALNDAEAALIIEFDSIENGYNIRPGGRESPLAEETKKKIGLALAGVPKTEAHRIAAAKALPPWSEDRKEQVRKMNQDPEHIAKCIAGATGKKRSEQGKLNMSLAKIGKPWSEERKTANPNKGRPWSAARRAADNRKGKPWSAARRAAQVHNDQGATI